MKFKILYNFLYEHIDVNDFLSNCMNLYELRNNLNYLENSSNHSNEEIFPFYLKDHINPSYTPVIVLYILMTLFTFVCILNIYFKKSIKKFAKNIYKFFIKQKTKIIIQAQPETSSQINEISNENDETGV